jgi:methionyl aminopeptidase
MSLKPPAKPPKTMFRPKSADYYRQYEANGQDISAILAQLVKYAQTHQSKDALEAKAQELIHASEGEPAFMRVPGYRWATCINVNDEIVHSIPKGRFQVGDMVTIDLGMYRHHTTTDTATTFVIGTPTPTQTHFMTAGQRALRKAIKAARVGNRVKDISAAIQHSIEGAGYNVVRTLTGHGVGATMHETPSIPCFVSRDPALNTRLEPGMVLALEVMYTQGDWRLKTGSDGWTLSTADGSLSAVYEVDVILYPDYTQVITPTPDIPLVPGKTG